MAAVPEAFDRSRARPCPNAPECAWCGCGTSSLALRSKGGGLLHAVLQHFTVALSLQLEGREEAERELVTGLTNSPRAPLGYLRSFYHLTHTKKNPFDGYETNFCHTSQPTPCHHCLCVPEFRQSLLQKLTHACPNKNLIICNAFEHVLTEQSF